MTRIAHYDFYYMSASWLSMAYTAQNLYLPRDVDYYVEASVLDAVDPAARHLRAACIEELV